MQLNQQIDNLQLQLTLRQGELEAMQDAPPAPAIEGVQSPRVVGIIVGKYSGGIDLTRDGIPDELRVYLRPVDQQGRFMSTAGQARVRLIVTPADGEPTTLVDQQYDPEAFDSAFRSGFTGTHYTLVAKLPESPPDSALLQVTFTEAARGLTFTAERIVPLRGSQPPENQVE